MTHRRSTALYLLLGAALVALIAGAQAPTAAATESGLPRPTSVAPAAFERQLYDFLDARRYAELGWAEDKGVRDTGPYLDGAAYGTHPAVRIFYSPEVVAWLEAGRPSDRPIPDGAVIVKEMYTPPAARYDGMTAAEVTAAVTAWTVMVRDAVGSKDGWYWAYYAPGQAVDSDAYPFGYPNAGFGLYCVRCHASAEGGFTFASLRNVAGYPGEPIRFRVDDSWLERAADDGALLLPHVALARAQAAPPDAQTRPRSEPDPAFLARFDAIPAVDRASVLALPPVTMDHVVAPAAPPTAPEHFLTSDQCLSCHDGQGAPFGPNMLVPADAGHGAVNLSPYGEWNWSMMGLAGRDPIFYAQLESESALFPAQAGTIENLCLRCHGVMGQRQWHADGREGDYRLDTLRIADATHPDHAYGALSRDGISCMVCHQVVNDGGPLRDIVTGRVALSGPVDGVSAVYGPVERPATLPMAAALGLEPKRNEYVTSSRLCAGCHTIFLPVFDQGGEQIGEGFEQVTYLEWLNSDFRDAGRDPTSCQDCHMTDEYRGTKLAFRIANIQDQTYPEVDNRAPLDQITVPIRGLDGDTLPPALDALGDEPFRRHTLLGINLFGLEMFDQFDDVLGVRKTDVMTGSDRGLPTAIAEATRLAREETARVEIESAALDGDGLAARVRVTNLTGHRFPSGVGFRRAFLEVRVEDADGQVVWASGRTDGLGLIVDEQGRPLPSELFEADPVTGEPRYEPHHQTVTRQDQAQIYQELTKDASGAFTTSFLARVDTVKDNRLLPRGWTAEGPPGFAEAYSPEAAEAAEALAATRPEGGALSDRQFLDGSGSDVVEYRATLPSDVLAQAAAGRPPTVTATLYYQSIPPYYLRDRFDAARGDSTRRLHYLTSHLTTDGTAIEGWKILVASDSAAAGTE